MVRSDYSLLSGRELIKLLNKFYGIELIGQKGSHIKIELKLNKKRTVIPNHKELAYGTFSGILEQLGIDEKTFFLKIKVNK